MIVSRSYDVNVGAMVLTMMSSSTSLVFYSDDGLFCDDFVAREIHSRNSRVVPIRTLSEP